jgi:Transglutaminase-like superfamily
MKKLFTLRSIFSLALLLIAVSALISGIKVSVLEVQDASFFPLAAITVTLSYLLGFGSRPAWRAWPLILTVGFYIAFFESARLWAPIGIILRSIPQFELGLLRWILTSEPANASIFQTQFNVITASVGVFTSHVFSGSLDDPSVREFIWDIPLLLLCAWAGWRISRHNQILTALAPSLAFHALILNYTGKGPVSLQMAVFALILLIGINQKWSSASEKSENFQRATRETYSAVIVLSIGIAIVAGLTPSFSFQELAKKLTHKDEVAKTIGLEREIVQSAPISGLPRQHLIGLSPAASRTVIFTVKTGELAPAESAVFTEAVPRHYWRWLTYDIYNAHGWATSPVETNLQPANEALLSFASEKYQVIHQQVDKALTPDSRLFWTGFLVSVNQPFNISWRTKPQAGIDPLLAADLLGAVSEQQSYEADSIVPILSANELRASSPEYPQEISARYLALPETIPQRVVDLARQITAQAGNPYDKAKFIETYLRAYPYSLEIPPPPQDRDIVDYFLFDLKKGYCDYYASSMVVMARIVGLPARLVIGYAQGVYDPQGAKYVVHEAEAHSWVEVYFTGVGWVEFEPTAGQLQLDLPDNLPEENIAPTPTVPPTADPAERRLTALAKKGFFPHREVSRFPFAGMLIGIVLLLSAWFLRSQGFLRSHKTIASIYDYIYFHGRKIYRNAPLYETVSLFEDHLRRQLGTGNRWLLPAPAELKFLTDLYIQEMYSAHPVTTGERKLARKVWRRLFWRLLYARMVHL